MSSSFGNKIKVQVFGQSHSEALGVVIDGLPPNEGIDLNKINAFLARRKSSNKIYATKRSEPDVPEIISGLINDKTCGAPLCVIFRNLNAKSSDYSQFASIPRPSHADYNAFIKYDGSNDIRGGGHFSGRLTLPVCFAGAVCLQILERKGIFIGAHISSLGSIKDSPFDYVSLSANDLNHKDFPVNDAKIEASMVQAILSAQREGDSIGGTVECAIVGMPQGVGDPMFNGVENRLSAAIFGIPAIKGIEFGAGFKAADMKGSEHNDEYYYDNEILKMKSNNSGGILGGITTGMPIVFKVAVKPTPSIEKEQASVNIETKENVKLKITGRHDPCIVPRVVACVEAVAAITMLDMLYSCK